MKIMFQFEGREFELLVESVRAWLVVDGNLLAGHAVEVTGGKDQKKTDFAAVIAERKKELQRCRECGRATRKQIRAMETTIDLFERITTERDFYRTPQPPVR